MQKLHLTIKVLLLLTIVFIGSPAGVYGQQLDSVKDCIEQPEKCNEQKSSVNKSDDQENETRSNNVGVSIWDFAKMIFATIFVVALIYLLLKFINMKTKGYKSNQLIQNIGGTSLGNNRSVQLIKVGDRIFVLGIGENVELLKEISDKEEAGAILEEYNRSLEQLIEPSDIVTKVLKKVKNVREQKEEKEISSFSAEFKEQLKEMSEKRTRLFSDMEKKESEKE